MYSAKTTNIALVIYLRQEGYIFICVCLFVSRIT